MNVNTVITYLHNMIFYVWAMATEWMYSHQPPIQHPSLFWLHLKTVNYSLLTILTSLLIIETVSFIHSSLFLLKYSSLLVKLNPAIYRYNLDWCFFLHVLFTDFNNFHFSVHFLPYIWRNISIFPYIYCSTRCSF